MIVTKTIFTCCSLPPTPPPSQASPSFDCCCFSCYLFFNFSFHRFALFPSFLFASILLLLYHLLVAVHEIGFVFIPALSHQRLSILIGRSVLNRFYRFARWIINEWWRSRIDIFVYLLSVHQATFDNGFFLLYNFTFPSHGLRFTVSCVVGVQTSS